MKRKLITLDEDTANLLSRYPNQSDIIRKAVQLYIEHISTDTVEGMRASYKLIALRLQELDAKIDYIASKVQ